MSVVIFSVCLAGSQDEQNRAGACDVRVRRGNTRPLSHTLILPLWRLPEWCSMPCLCANGAKRLFFSFSLSDVVLLQGFALFFFQFCFFGLIVFVHEWTCERSSPRGAVKFFSCAHVCPPKSFSFFPPVHAHKHNASYFFVNFILPGFCCWFVFKGFSRCAKSARVRARTSI